MFQNHTPPAYLPAYKNAYMYLNCKFHNEDIRSTSHVSHTTRVGASCGQDVWTIAHFEMSTECSNTDVHPECSNTDLYVGRYCESKCP